MHQLELWELHPAMQEKLGRCISTLNINDIELAALGLLLQQPELLGDDRTTVTVGDLDEKFYIAIDGRESGISVTEEGAWSVDLCYTIGRLDVHRHITIHQNHVKLHDLSLQKADWLTEDE